MTELLPLIFCGQFLLIELSILCIGYFNFVKIMTCMNYKFYNSLFSTRRRLPVVMVRNHMAETLKAATTFIEQGRILGT